MTLSPRLAARHRRIRRRTIAVVLLGIPLLMAAGGQGPARPLRQIAIHEFARGLSRPTGIAAANDKSGRVFVLEQLGMVMAIDADGVVQSEPFLDLSGMVSSGTEQGLLGLAFHPEFATNGRLFVDYTDVDGDTVVAEYSAPDGNAADPRSARVLLTIDQPHEFHNGGGLVFGPDGYLYIGVGDGGWPNDVIGTGQDTSTLFGSLLRIDVDHRTDGLPYAIPGDNPFANGGGRGEIWDYGLRNPWRFGWDSKTDDLYIADVGQLTYEEIDRHPAGLPGGMNFGWSVKEGMECFNGRSCDDSGMTDPILVYGGRRLATGNCAIVGGPVYRGDAIPHLDGRLLFGDYCSGRIWSLVVGVDGTVPELQLDTDLIISTFGTDADGMPLLADYARGILYRVSATR